MIEVCGLDLAYAGPTGWARLDEHGGLVSCGIIQVHKSIEGGARLRQLAVECELVSRGATDVWREASIVRGSATAAMKLSQVAGAVMAAISAGQGREVGEVTTNQIKKIATGNGRAEKIDVTAAARARWGERVIDGNVADACWAAEWGRLVDIDSGLFTPST